MRDDPRRQDRAVVARGAVGATGARRGDHLGARDPARAARDRGRARAGARGGSSSRRPSSRRRCSSAAGSAATSSASTPARCRRSRPRVAHGTVVSPGTVASPRTGASRAQPAITPGSGGRVPIGASRLARRLAGSSVREDSDAIETREVPPVDRPAPGGSPLAAPTAPTMLPPLSVRASQANLPSTVATSIATSALASHPAAIQASVVAGRMPGIPADAETSDARETVELDRAGIVPMSSGPSVVPTEFVAPLSGPRPRISEQREVTPPPPAARRRARVPDAVAPDRASAAPAPPPARHRDRRAGRARADLVRDRARRVALAGPPRHAPARRQRALVARARRRTRPRRSPTPDAPVAARHPRVVAEPIAAIAPADPRSRDAYLEIVTFPGGGKVKVGDQARVAPGADRGRGRHYRVVAELAGYLPETRQVTIERGEHQASSSRSAARSPAAAARARPRWAGSRCGPRRTARSSRTAKKLGETPFADRRDAGGLAHADVQEPATPDRDPEGHDPAARSPKLNFALPD